MKIKEDAAKLVVSCVLFVCAVPVFAEERFLFVADDDNVLATLVLDKLPATYEDIQQLTFSDLGQSIFGFGPIYTGAFDSMTSANFPQFIAEPPHGLAGIDADGVFSISARDFVEIPFSDLAEIVSMIEFDVGASSVAGPSDTLTMRFLNATGETPVVQKFGTWVRTSVVPEPCSQSLLILACAATLLLLRTRQ